MKARASAGTGAWRGSPRTAGRRSVLSVAAGVVALLIASGAPPAVLGQQTGAITVEVRDASTLGPLSGVQISIQGTDVGGLSGEDGRFRITGVPAGEQRVVAQFLGYQTVTRTVAVEGGLATELTLSLNQSAIEMDEIVVTGTAVGARRRELGNTVSTIDAARLADQTKPASVGELLQGQASGLVSMSGTGQIGAGQRLKIRGTASLSLDDQPLIYVDGVRINNDIGAGPNAQGYGAGVISRLNDISPAEIERIEVIKGPAAATLYGTEANNGVIQIFTKSGTATGTQWTVQVEQGSNWLGDMANRTGYGDRGRRLFDIWGPDPESGEPRSWNMVQREQDRGNQIWRAGHMQSYNASVTGGGAEATYFVMGGYERDEGVYPTNRLWRINGRTNVSFAPTDEWSIESRLGIVKADFKLADDIGSGPIFNSMYTFPFLVDTPNRGFLIAPPDVLYESQQSSQRLDRFTGSIQVRNNPSDWFQHRLTVGLDETQEDNIVQQPFLGPEGVTFFGETGARGGRDFEKRSVSKVTADYSASVTATLSDDFNSETSVGAQFYATTVDLAMTEGVEFAAPGLETVTSTAQRFAGEAFTRNVTVGTFAQERIGWHDRRFLTLGLRVDNNSAFGDDFSFVTYPKVSGSWVLSEEPFWNVGLFNSLRVRAAYGQTGQQPESFSALRFFLPVTTGTGEPGLKPEAPGNPDLKPETGEEWEAGFEAGLFGDRLGLNVTYYDQNVRDVLLQRPLAPSSGFPGTQWINAGEVSSNGIEFEADITAVDSRNVQWEIGLNASRNFNEVVDVSAARSGSTADGNDFVVLDIELDTPGIHMRHQEGLPPGSWFGFEVVSAEFDDDGNAINVMCDGGPGADHQPVPCDEAPFVFLGQSIPKVQGSLSSSVTLFGDLTVSGLLDMKWGQKHGDNDTIVQCQLFRVCRENLVPTEYGAERIAQFQSSNLSNFAVADASFARLRSVSVDYSLPPRLLGVVGANGATLSVSAHNLGLWTSWPSLDPETYFTEPTDTSPIFDKSSQTFTPQPYRFTASLRLQF